MSETKKGLPGEEVAGDELELRSMLHRWHAPVPSASLDERVLSAFRCQTDAAVAATVNIRAAQFSEDQSEVVKMKECQTCHETFADKFVFCPTDGTPLTNGFHADRAFDPDATAEAAGFAASAAAANSGGDEGGHEAYHLTMLQDAGLLNRLTTQVRTESQEFKRDPKGYIDSLFTDVLAALKRPLTAAATLASILLVLGAITAFVMLDGMRVSRASNNPNENLEYIGEFPLTEIPKEQPTPDPGDAGEAKGKGGGSKPKQEKPGGGGGGGRVDAPEEVSFGKRPLTTLQQPQVLAPKPEPPTIRNPSLPTLATVRADDALFPPDLRKLPYGDDRSKLTTPSAGRGGGDGMGGGDGSGFGKGSGRGVGPGEGENTGGGRTNLGGGGPGGGGGGAPAVDYNRVFKTSELSSRIQIVSKPEPGYTEEARKNNIQGSVSLRVLFASNGTVSSVSPLKRLPDGLTEKAIAAAKQIKFIPAEKDGRKVSTWAQVNYAFNIY